MILYLCYYNLPTGRQVQKAAYQMFDYQQSYGTRNNINTNVRSNRMTSPQDNYFNFTSLVEFYH